MKRTCLCFLMAALLLVGMMVPAFAAGASVELTKVDVTEGVFLLEGTAAGAGTGDRLLLAVYDAEGHILSAAEAALENGCFARSMPAFDVPEGDYLVKVFLTDSKGAPKADCAVGCVRYVNQPTTLYSLTGVDYLVIGEGVGNGDVTLDGVSYAGETYVHGGGEHSIHIINRSSVGNIIISKTESGAIRIFSEEGSCVEFLQVADGKDDIIVEGTVNTVEIHTDKPVILSGANVEKVEVAANDAKVTVAGESVVAAVTVSAPKVSVDVSGGAAISVVKIGEAAENAALYVAEGSSTAMVDTAGKDAEIEAKGTVNQITATAATRVTTTENNTVTVLAAEGASVTKETGTKTETVAVTSAAEILNAQKTGAKETLDRISAADYVNDSTVETKLSDAKADIDAADTSDDVLQIMTETLAALAKEPTVADQAALSDALSSLETALQDAFSAISKDIARRESSLKQKIGQILDAAQLPEGVKAAVSGWSYTAAVDGYDPVNGNAEFRLSVFKGQASAESQSVQSIVIPARGKAQTPDAAVEATTDHSVTLCAAEGAEYRMGNGAWQSSPVFEGLNPVQKYTFYVRIAGTEDTLASDSTSVTVMTQPAGGGVLIHSEDELLAAAGEENAVLYLTRSITLTQPLWMQNRIEIPKNVTLTIAQGAELGLTGISSELKIYGEGRLVIEGGLSMEFLTPEEPGDYFPVAIEFDLKEGSNVQIRACVTSRDTAEWALNRNWIAQTQFFKNSVISGDLYVPQNKCLSIVRGTVTLEDGELCVDGALDITDQGELVNNGLITNRNELFIAENSKLTNNGTIRNESQIILTGRMANSGKIIGNREQDGKNFWYNTQLYVDANPVRQFAAVLENTGTIDDQVTLISHYFGEGNKSNITGTITGSNPGEDSNPGLVKVSYYTNDPTLAFQLLSRKNVDEVALYGAAAGTWEDAPAVELSGSNTVPAGKQLRICHSVVYDGDNGEVWYYIRETVIPQDSTLTVEKDGGIDLDSGLENNGSLIVSGYLNANASRKLVNNGSITVSETGNLNLENREETGKLENNGTLKNNGYLGLWNGTKISGSALSGSGNVFVCMLDALPAGSTGYLELETDSGSVLAQAMQDPQIWRIYLQGGEEPIVLTGSHALDTELEVRGGTTLRIEGSLTVNNSLSVFGKLEIAEGGSLTVNGGLWTDPQWDKNGEMPTVLNNGTLTVTESGCVEMLGELRNNGTLNNQAGHIHAYVNPDAEAYPCYGQVIGAEVTTRRRVVLDNPDALYDALTMSGEVQVVPNFGFAEIREPVVITGNIELVGGWNPNLEFHADLTIEGRLVYDGACIKQTDGTLTVAENAELRQEQGGGLEIWNEAKLQNNGSIEIFGWLDVDWNSCVSGNPITLRLNRAEFARRFYEIFGGYLPACEPEDYDDCWNSVADWNEMFYEDGNHDNAVEGFAYLLKNGLIAVDSDGRLRPYEVMSAAEEKAVYAAMAQKLGKNTAEFLNSLTTEGQADATMSFCTDSENPENHWWDSSFSQRMESFRLALGMYREEVSTEAQLTAALEKSYVTEIRITDSFTLNTRLDICEVPNWERYVEIAPDAELTVAQNVELSLNRNTRMCVSGKLTVLGGMNVFGRLDSDDWNNRIITGDGGWINFFCDTMEFTKRAAEQLNGRLELPEDLELDTWLKGQGIDTERMWNWPEGDNRFHEFLLCMYYGNLRPIANQWEENGETVTDYNWQVWEYPTYGEIKTILSGLYQAVMQINLPADVCLTDNDGEFQDDWLVCDRDMEDLLNRFAAHLPKTKVGPADGETQIKLTLLRHKDEDRDYYTLNGGEELEDTTLRNLCFTVPVVITAASGNEDGYAGMLNFINCEFAQGIQVQCVENLGFNLDFTDSCTITNDWLRVSLPSGVSGKDYGCWHAFWGVGGFIIDAMSIPCEITSDTGFTLSNGIAFSGQTFLNHRWDRDENNVWQILDIGNNGDSVTVVTGSSFCDTSVNGWLDLSGFNVSQNLYICSTDQRTTTVKLGNLSGTTGICGDEGCGYDITTTKETYLYISDVQEGFITINGELIGYPHLYGSDGIYIGTVNAEIVDSIKLYRGKYNLTFEKNYLDDDGQPSQTPAKVHLTQGGGNWYPEGVEDPLMLTLTVGDCHVTFDRLWEKYNSEIPVKSEAELLEALAEGRPIRLEADVTLHQALTLHRGLREDGYRLTLAENVTLTFELEWPDEVQLSCPFTINGAAVLPENGTVCVGLGDNVYGSADDPEYSSRLELSGAVRSVTVSGDTIYHNQTLREFCFRELTQDCELKLTAEYTAQLQENSRKLLRIRSYDAMHTVKATGTLTADCLELSGEGVTDVTGLSTTLGEPIYVGFWDRGTTVYTGTQSVGTEGRIDGETRIHAEPGADIHIYTANRNICLICGENVFFPGTPHIFGGDSIYLGCTGLTAADFRLYVNGAEITGFAVEEIAEDNKVHIRQGDAESWFHEGDKVSLTVLWNGIQLTYEELPRKLTRSSLCVKLAAVLGLDTEHITECSFNDLSENDPAYGAIKACVDAGIMNGTSANTFSPDSEVTRESLAVVLSRALNLTDTGEIEEGWLENVPEWALDGVRKILTAEVMWVDENGYFRPGECAMDTDVDWSRVKVQ